MKIPWRREWLPSPVFLPRDSHGEKSLVATVCRVAKSQRLNPGLHWQADSLPSEPPGKPTSQCYVSIKQHYKRGSEQSPTLHVRGPAKTKYQQAEETYHLSEFKKKSLKTLATISFVKSFSGVWALLLVWETAFVLNVNYVMSAKNNHFYHDCH